MSRPGLMRRAVPVVGLIAALLAVRVIFLNFHLEGPPAKAPLADDRQVAQSQAQALIRVPLKQTERFLESQLKAKGALTEGTTEQLALDTLRGALGLRVREVVKCEPTEAALAAMDAVKCFEKIKSDGLKKAAERAVCIAKFGIDSVESTFQIADACIDKHSPIKLPDRPTEIAYAVHLEKLNLEMSGKVMQARALARLDVTLPKGILETYFKAPPKRTCLPKVIATAQLTPKLAVVENKLVLNAKVGKVHLRTGPDCKGKVTNLSKTILNKLDDQLLAGLSVVFQEKMKTMLEEQMNDPAKLESAQAKLVQAGYMAQQPFPLHLPPPADVPVSLILNPERLLVSQARGKANGKSVDVEIAVGVLARPVLRLGPVEAGTPETLPIALKKPGNRFSVTPTASLQLDALSAEAGRIARDVVADILPDLRYRSLDIRLYQAGERLVIGADIKGVGWLRLNGSVYLTARPEFVAEDTVVRLRDIKFDLDTTDFLLRRAAWILESPIEAALEERLKFGLGPQFRDILTVLADFRHQAEFDYSEHDPGHPDYQRKVFTGQAAAQLSELALDQIWLDQNSMNVSVRAAGSATFEVKTLE